MSEKNGAFELNMKPLEDLIKALNEQAPSVRVGILGGTTQRSPEGTKFRSQAAVKTILPMGDVKLPKLNNDKTNAEIGLEHEFGTETLPRRSFLRFPIMMQMQKYLDESNFFGSDSLKIVLNEKSLRSWVAKIGIVAENVVGDAFETGGFGLWKPSIMTGKKIQQTLVETTQLRDSIHSEVKK